MKFAFFITLLFLPQAFAQTFQSRVHECKNEYGFQRRLELQYQSPQAAVPCRVVFFRGDVEDNSMEHVLRIAEHDSGDCEEKEGAYLSKMKSWGVTCQLVTPPASVVAASTPPSKVAEKVPVAAPLHDWTGKYAGLILGSQFGRSKTQTGSFGYNNDNQEWNYNESGLNAAAEFGHNFHSGKLVFGPEVELGYLSLKGSGAQADAPASDTSGKSSSDFYMALRARIGADLGRTLLFATAGVMGVNYQAEVLDACNIAPCGGSTVDAKKKSFVWGYTLGAGVERMLENNWSLKAEYLYFNLASQSFSGTTNLGDSYDWKGQTSGNILRVGIDYHF